MKTENIRSVVVYDGFKARSFTETDLAGHWMEPTGKKGLGYYRSYYFIKSDELWIDTCVLDELPLILLLVSASENHSFKDWGEERAFIQKELGARNENQENVVISETTFGGVKVQYVDGAKVRKSIDPSWWFGGHSVVYPNYIPKGVIWIDAKLHPQEQKYVLIHEYVEYMLMLKGHNYIVGHALAKQYEEIQRRLRGAIYPGDPGYIHYGKDDDYILKQFTLCRLTIDAAKNPAVIAGIMNLPNFSESSMVNEQLKAEYLIY